MWINRLTAQGLARGLADAGWHDVLGLKDFLSDPVAGLNGLQHIVTDPATRTQLGEAIYQELNAKIERMQTAVTVGGQQNAEQLGKNLGELVWQVGSIAQGWGVRLRAVRLWLKWGLMLVVEGWTPCAKMT